MLEYRAGCNEKSSICFIKVIPIKASNPRIEVAGTGLLELGLDELKEIKIKTYLTRTFHTILGEN